jgi:hypothetical protein
MGELESSSAFRLFAALPTLRVSLPMAPAATLHGSRSSPVLVQLCRYSAVSVHFSSFCFIIYTLNPGYELQTVLAK